MFRDLIKPEILDLIEAGDWLSLKDAMADWPARDATDLLLHLRKQDRVLLFRALHHDLATRIFSFLETDEQNALLADLGDEETRRILTGLPPDDRTQLLEELPGLVTQRLLNLLDAEDLAEARTLLGYPEQSVGRLMTPAYVAVRPDWTAEEALRHVRAHGQDSETIHRVYVVSDDWRLLADIDLRRLILADPAARVQDLTDRAFTAISAFADRGDAVRMIRRYGLVALPVLDSTGVLLGIVTVDDLLDVAVTEATEDFHRVGSVEPIRTSLREAGVGILYRRRIGWLLVLVFMNVLSGAGIALFQDVIASTVALVFFLPLLIGSAGNAGSQAATLMIRAMATGDVRARDWLGLVGKELAVATFLGLTMAAAVSTFGFLRGGARVGIVVAATMVLVVVVGSLVGMSLPFLLNRLRFDPATASAPLVTSIADISGVLIYFTLASWLLGP